MRSLKLHRRAVLRGLCSGLAASVALPPLEAMLNSNGTAYAQGVSIPKRFGIFFWGNGIRINRWVPSGTGTSWVPSPELQPLSTVKDYRAPSFSL
jgi:hypothetical protein